MLVFFIGLVLLDCAAAIEYDCALSNWEKLPSSAANIRDQLDYNRVL